MARGAQERTMADLVYVGLNRRVVALDRADGQVVWENPLKGYGSALSSIVSVNGSGDGAVAAAAIAEQAAAAAAAAG